MQSHDGARAGLGQGGELPTWISDPDRPRDPESGYLQARRCEYYRAGHTVHYIQANRSAGRPSRAGRLLQVDENIIIVDFGDETKHYRNHDPERLVDVIGLGGAVHLCERYVILRSPGGYCFSISDAALDWVPCDFTPLRSITSDALAERIETHGGFSVSGQALIAETREGA